MNRSVNRYGCAEPHVSTVCQTTADELREHLRTRTELANGLLNRFLIVGVKRAGYLSRGRDYWTVATAHATALQGAVATARGFTAPYDIADDACGLWDAEYRRLERERPGDWGRAAARLSVHTLKIAMLYAALDGQTAIGLPHLKAALSLADYGDRSARLVFSGRALGHEAERLLAFARSRPNGITRTDAINLFKRNRSADLLSNDINELTNAGLIVVREGRFFAREHVDNGPTGAGGGGDEQADPSPVSTGPPETNERIDEFYEYDELGKNAIRQIRSFVDTSTSENGLIITTPPTHPPHTPPV